MNIVTMFSKSSGHENENCNITSMAQISLEKEAK